jgi:hypothetical protein
MASLIILVHVCTKEEITPFIVNQVVWSILNTYVYCYVSFFVIWKQSLHTSDGQQFHQCQLNKQSRLTLTHWT